jgi:hypothetical protein
MLQRQHPQRKTRASQTGNAERRLPKARQKDNWENRGDHHKISPENEGRKYKYGLLPTNQKK